jgi:hypothetical protein
MHNISASNTDIADHKWPSWKLRSAQNAVLMAADDILALFPATGLRENYASEVRLAKLVDC